MTSGARWVWLVGVVVALGVLALATRPASRAAASLDPQHPSPERGVATADVGHRVEIYQEVMAARARAQVAARIVAPESAGGSPLAPGSDKGSAKRAGLVEVATEEAIRDVAVAGGLERAEVEAIVREGQSRRWSWR